MFFDGLSLSHSTFKERQEDINKTLQREINLAKKIQTKLLNGKTPTFEGGEVSGTSIPARLIGGDYYDFYPLVNGKIRIVIGDVMGKGIPAAMLMILTRGAFRSAAESTQSPGETLTAMNQALYEDLRNLKSFVTLFCADWDPASGILTFANAGHNIPLLISEEEYEIKALPKISGIMVGGLPNQVYKEESTSLRPNDTVFFYTDGIIEAINKDRELYQIDRLISTLAENKDKTVQEIQDGVIHSIQDFTEGVPQKDDITMVILKVMNGKSDITSFNSPVLTI